MKRKIVGQGKQAFTITLPVEWVRENSLDVGDEIDLNVHGKNILIRTDKRSKGGYSGLNLEGLSDRLKYLYVNAAYAKGVDEIRVTAEKSYYPEVGHNVGYAVVSQKQGLSIIRDISGVSHENLDEIFKRVFQMIIGFLEQAIADVFSDGKETDDTLRKKDMEINKFCLFLQRAIMKQIYPDPKMGKILFGYAFALEALSDDVFRLWRSCFNNSPKAKELKEFVNISMSALENAFAVYYRPETKLIRDGAKYKWKARKQVEELLKKHPKHAMFLLYSLKINEGAYDMVPLALMRHTKSKRISKS